MREVERRRKTIGGGVDAVVVSRGVRRPDVVIVGRESVECSVAASEVRVKRWRVRW